MLLLSSLFTAIFTISEYCSVFLQWFLTIWVICLVSALEITIYILIYQKQLQIYTNLNQMSYIKHYSFMALFPFSCFCGIALCVCLLKKLRGKNTAIVFLQVFVNMNSYHFWLFHLLLWNQITTWGIKLPSGVISLTQWSFATIYLLCTIETENTLHFYMSLVAKYIHCFIFY